MENETENTTEVSTRVLKMRLLQVFLLESSFQLCEYVPCRFRRCSCIQLYRVIQRGITQGNAKRAGGENAKRDLRGSRNRVHESV